MTTRRAGLMTAATVALLLAGALTVTWPQASDPRSDPEPATAMVWATGPFGAGVEAFTQVADLLPVSKRPRVMEACAVLLDDALARPRPQQQILVAVSHPLASLGRRLAASFSTKEQQQLCAAMGVCTFGLGAQTDLHAAMHEWATATARLLALPAASALHVDRPDGQDQAIALWGLTAEQWQTAVTQATARFPPHNAPTWEVLVAINATLARRIKALACGLDYDCNVDLPAASKAGPLRWPHGWAAFPVGICTRMRDEAGHLLEWLAFHRLVGVSRVHVFVDNCTDNTLALLMAMQQQRPEYTVVRVFDVANEPTLTIGQQEQRMVHDFRDLCLARNRAQDRVEWFLMIDADEFAYARDFDLLPTHLQTRCAPQLTHIPLSWRYFGSNGRALPADDLLVASYPRWGLWRPTMTKIIVNARCVLETATHYPTKVAPWPEHCMAAFRIDDIRQVPLVSQWATLQDKACRPGLLLNHYAVKSRSEYLAKFTRGAINTVAREANLTVWTRERFAAEYGPLFVAQGTEALQQQVAVALPTLPADEAAEFAYVAQQAFLARWLQRDLNEHTDTDVVRYLPALRTLLRAFQQAIIVSRAS